jgi:hypothetical protein
VGAIWFGANPNGAGGAGVTTAGTTRWGAGRVDLKIGGAKNRGAIWFVPVRARAAPTGWGAKHPAPSTTPTPRDRTFGISPLRAASGARKPTRPGRRSPDRPAGPAVRRARHPIAGFRNPPGPERLQRCRILPAPRHKTGRTGDPNGGLNGPPDGRPPDQRGGKPPCPKRAILARKCRRAGKRGTEAPGRSAAGRRKITTTPREANTTARYPRSGVTGRCIETGRAGRRARSGYH